MANAEQIKSLIRSHFDDDEERFFSIALQVAAYEAQQGHGALAQEIRKIIDKKRRDKRIVEVRFPNELAGLVLPEKSDVSKSRLIIPTSLKDRINRIIHEYRQQSKLKSHGLKHRRKIMLIGPPGTGKTMTAKVLAHELRLNLLTIQVDKLVTKFMGETSAK
ncbi:AAA family ATPase, partial [bacterium]|nr:AAA family ATPase [bacterium]MBU1024886.1 AAA family ATPase [bacterium]